MCLQIAWSLLKASWVLLLLMAHRLLAMVTHISSDFFICERGAVLLIWSGKMISKDSLIFICYGLGCWLGSLLEKLLSIGSSQWVSMSIIHVICGWNRSGLVLVAM